MKETGLDADDIARLISKTIAEGDSVRYTHLWNPDLLCITDSDLMESVRP